MKRENPYTTKQNGGKWEIWWGGWKLVGSADNKIEADRECEERWEADKKKGGG